jgi:hypothetical protein
MIIKNLGISLLLILYLSLIACAGTIKYSYNHVIYDSPEPALAVQKAENDVILSAVEPINHPVGGSVIVVLPSKSYFVRNMVDWKGHEPREQIKEQINNFNFTLKNNDLRARGEALEKRRIFDRVVITDNDNPEQIAFTEDTGLFFFKKYGKEQWFLKKKNSNTMIEIEETSTAFPKAQRLMWWLDNIEKIARNK